MFHDHFYTIYNEKWIYWDIHFYVKYTYSMKREFPPNQENLFQFPVTRSSHRMYSNKVLKISQNSQGTLVPESLF